MELKEKVSILYYKEWASLAMEMPDEMRLSIFDALNNYIINKEMPDRSSPCYWVFVGWANQLKRDEEKYIALCEKNSANGKKGGRPRKPNETQKSEGFLDKPKKADKEEDYDKDKEEDKENEKVNEEIDTKNSLSRFYSIYPNLRDKFIDKDSFSKQQYEDIITGEDKRVKWNYIEGDESCIVQRRIDIANEKLFEMNNYTFTRKPKSLCDTLISWINRDYNGS